MKKTLVRLLSVILAAVMIFPAAAFADDPITKDISLWCGTEKDNTYSLATDITLADVTNWATSGTGEISLDETTGVVTAVSAGNVTLTAIHTDENGTSIVGVWNFTITKRSAQSIAVTKTPTKTKYISGDTFDPTGMVITVTYNNKETGTVDLSTCKFTPDPLTADTTEVTIIWGELKATTPVTVGENVVTKVSIYSAPSQAYVGDRLKDLDIQVQVTWADDTSAVMESGWEPTPSGALTKDDKSFYVTFQNVKSEIRPIKVVDKPSEGGGGSGGSGGGGGETTTEEYTLTAVTTSLKKKSYNVGDTFDTDGLVVQVRNKATNALVASLTGLTGTNALILDTPYVFTSTDVSPTTGTTKTSTIKLVVWYSNKAYEVPVTGLTVTVPKKNLSVKTSGSSVRNILVEMKNKHYPVGTTIGLTDIYRISGFDANDKEFIYYYPETLEFGNISLEVASVNNRGETSRKSASGRSRIDSGDVYTKATDEKVVYLRLYVDDTYYHEFPVSSGDPAVSVYTSSAYSSSYQIGTFDDLAEALDYVNDVDYQWGSTSASVYPASRTLYLKLAEDADLNRYYVIPARNFEIDLNGRKLTMYTDSFRFRDRYDTYTATLTNTSTTTSKVTYTDLPADELLVPLVDKGEKLVFKYQESSTANAPGIYTITIAEIKEGGAVTAKPAANTRNNVTTVTIAHGNDVTFTVTPNKDFQIDSVKTKTGTAAEQTVSVSTNSNYSVNSSTGVATYTMKDIKADTTLNAAFKAVKKEEEKKEEEKKEEKPAETPWTNPFTDVRSTAGYYDAVKYVNQNGLMDGMTATTFGPDRTMTRAQFVTVLGRMFLGSLGVPNLETTTQKYESMLGTYGVVSQFSDVSNDDPTLKNWAVPYIIWAEKEGLGQGLGNGKFDPQGPITHQQMYIIMYRYAQYIAHQTINPSTLPALRATDADKIGEGWKMEAKEGAIAAAKYAQQQSFLVSSVVIDPAGNALRNELAILLMQFSKNVLGWE